MLGALDASDGSRLGCAKNRDGFCEGKALGPAEDPLGCWLTEGEEDCDSCSGIISFEKISVSNLCFCTVLVDCTASFRSSCLPNIILRHSKSACSCSDKTLRSIKPFAPEKS